MAISIFNEVIGPVMRGASSSHCAAAQRIGRLARDLAGGRPERLRVIFDLQGSLPTTHESQGSDMGLFGGLLGWSADDPRLPDSRRYLEEAGTEIAIDYEELGDPHPNTYHLQLVKDGQDRSLKAISTGGGMVEIRQIDGVPVSFRGDYDETLAWFDRPLSTDPELIRRELGADHVVAHEGNGQVLLQISARSRPDSARIDAVAGAGARKVDRLQAVLPVRSRRDIRLPFESLAGMMAAVTEPETPLWRLALDYESARSGLSEPEVLEMMRGIIRILKACIAEGLAGTDYDDRILGAQSGRFRAALDSGRLFDAGLVNTTTAYVAAIMEVKSAMGVIVAAPTAGACAALPAACIAASEALGADEDSLAQSLLAAGLIGVFIDRDWSFAAEVGGCQAEGGSAAAMAAAALVTLQGGHHGEALAAASMALQNMLGLICDPVAGRVEVPCLGKNVMAAANAVACANMALAGFDAVIPLDQVIAAAREVSSRMPREHRCTALGGLAATEASQSIQLRLAGCKGCD